MFFPKTGKHLYIRNHKILWTIILRSQCLCIPHKKINDIIRQYYHFCTCVHFRILINLDQIYGFRLLEGNRQRDYQKWWFEKSMQPIALTNSDVDTGWIFLESGPFCIWQSGSESKSDLWTQSHQPIFNFLKNEHQLDCITVIPNVIISIVKITREEIMLCWAKFTDFLFQVVCSRMMISISNFRDYPDFVLVQKITIMFIIPWEHY